MTRLNALVMPLEADATGARKTFNDLKREFESTPINLKFVGAATAGAATAGTNAPTAGAPVNGTAAGFTTGTPTGTFAGQVVGAPAQPINNFGVPPQNYHVGPVTPAQPFNRNAYVDRLAAQAAAGTIDITQMGRATSPEGLRNEEKMWDEAERTRVRDETRANREASRNADKFERQTQRANDISAVVGTRDARAWVKDYENTMSGVQEEAEGFYANRPGRPTVASRRREEPGGSAGMGGGKFILRGLAIAGYRAIATDATEYYVNNQRDSLRRAYSSLGDQLNQDVSDSQGILQSRPLPVVVGGILNAAGGLLHRLGSKGDSGDRYTDADTTRAAMEAKQVYESQQRGDEARIRARDLRGENALIGSSGLGKEFGETNETERREIARIEALRRADKTNQGDAGYLQEEAAVRDRAKRVRGDISARFGEDRAQLSYRSSIASESGRGNEYGAGETEMAFRQRSELFQAERDTKDLPGHDAYMQDLKSTQARERQAFSDQVIRRADIQIREQTGITEGAALSRRGYYEQGGETQIRAKYAAQIWSVDTSNPTAFGQIQSLIAARTEDLEQNKLNERRRQIGVSGEISSLQDTLDRRPLRARLDDIQTTRDVDLVGLKNPSERSRINRRADLQSSLATRGYSDESEMIGLDLSGRSRQLSYLLRSTDASGTIHMGSTAAAEAIGIGYSGVKAARAFEQSGRPIAAVDSLQNSMDELNLAAQNYGDRFRGQEMDFNLMDMSNQRDQADPEAFGKALQEAMRQIKDELANAIGGVIAGMVQ